MVLGAKQTQAERDIPTIRIPKWEISAAMSDKELGDAVGALQPLDEQVAD